MNHNSKQQIQRLMKDWLSQGETYSQAELSRKTGINGSYISQIKDGAWSDTIPSPAVWQKLARLFDFEQHHDSPNYLNIQGACRRAQMEQIRVGIDGYSGAGKTYSLRKYANSNPNVYLVTGRRSMGARSLLLEVAALVGLDRVRGGNYDLERAIAKRLEGRNALLIFDECEYLKPASYDSVKTLCDLLENKCGIILCGLNLKQAFDGGTDRNRPGMPQLQRRFEYKWLFMEGITSDEIRTVCKMNGITDTYALKWFVSKVKNYDSLQILIKDAVKESEKRKSNVSAELLADLFLN